MKLNKFLKNLSSTIVVATVLTASAYARTEFTTTSGDWWGPLDLNVNTMVPAGSGWVELHLCWHERHRMATGPISNCNVYDTSGFQNVLAKEGTFPVTATFSASNGGPVPGPWTLYDDDWLVDPNTSLWPVLADLAINQYYVLTLTDNDGSSQVTILRTSTGWDFNYSAFNRRRISSVPVILNQTVTVSGANWIITITSDDKLANYAWKQGNTCLPANNGKSTVTVPAGFVYKVYVMNEYGSIYRTISGTSCNSPVTTFGCSNCN